MAFSVFLVCLILGLLVGFVYYPSLEAYFTADDFWHLPYLYKAISLGHTELLWQNFSGPWIGKTTMYLFYRPITELTLAFDYLLFGNKAPGYHLSSILWHYVNCLLVYFVSLKILGLFDREKCNSRRSELVSFLVAIIFAIHPTQAEAVSWILSRADLVGGFFSLLTVYLALIFFENKKKLTFVLMLVSMLLGFGSKELCACLPFILLIVFYCLSRDLKRSLKLVALPFIFLAIFLVVRAWALGTPLGGYVGTHGYLLNQSLWERILVPYVWWKLAHPINERFICDFVFYDNCLRTSYFFLAISIILNISLGPAVQKRFMQSCIIFSVVLLLMIVNFQVWTICNSLANSRIFYLLLFPLALSVLNIVFPYKDESQNLKTNKLLYWQAIPASLLLVLAFSVLCNQAVQAWQSAGQKNKSMQEQIVRKIDSLPANKKLAVVNLPAFIDGTVSIFVTDFIKGLLSPPLLSKNYNDRIICLDLDLKTVNMQNLKDLASDPNVDLVLWNQKTNSMDESFSRRLKQAQLDRLKFGQPLECIESGLFKCPDWRMSKIKEFYENKNKGDEIVTYHLNLPEEVQIGRDLILSVYKNDNGKNDNAGKVKDLLYVSFDQAERSAYLDYPPFVFELPKQQLPIKLVVVPLSQEKSFLASSFKNDVRIDLPVCYQILQARMVDCDSLKPKLSLAGNIKQGANGYFTPSSSVKNLKFNFSCAHIKDTSGTLVEISKPNCIFSNYTGTLRDTKPSEHALKSIKLNDVQGSFSIPVSDFPQPAYYQVRIAPLSKEGEIISAFGDPVSMSLFSPNKN